MVVVAAAAAVMVVVLSSGQSEVWEPAVCHGFVQVLCMWSDSVVFIGC